MKFEPQMMYIGTSGEGFRPFMRFANTPTITDVTCDTTSPLWTKTYEEDTRMDFSEGDSWSFNFKLSARQEKLFMLRLTGQSNNWRKAHGLHLIRVPLRERRKRK